MLLLVGSLVQADNCSNRGVLDNRYCAENHDMVSDAPKDAANYKDPSTLVFTYTPVEDP
ncbi:MAG: phosphate/phosphite/phosphonate ABC transporter substrate-binding protein, partial [Arcobacter sp.]|nr:phosphate/phosphite/phosphonate ABC transporter substrate-binding protein [Arcobacter sp.]